MDRLKTLAPDHARFNDDHAWIEVRIAELVA